MLARIDSAAAEWQLRVLGGAEEALPEGLAAVVLLGPREPGFWAMFTAQPEYADGRPDPLDRWSRRAVHALAGQFGARALFPFSGPPHHPFPRWAVASGRAHVSPVGLLVHDEAGLWLSYRGALGLAQPLPEADRPRRGAVSPCAGCTARPCLTACPVDALRGDRYDVAACKTDLDRPGNDCMTRGCAVRRACPVSRGHGRRDEQSAFHMRAFR
ncbi:MAG: hypothetical protein Kow0058_07010 [Roseovarius sp.]